VAAEVSLAAAAEAKAKNLKVGVGLQRHHQPGDLETLKRIHDGAIGDITSLRPV
jgi:predicted dehydrogenase